MVTRVYEIKLKALLQDLKEAFRHQVSIIRIIKYQKRGVPYYYILLFIKDGVRIFSDAALVDQVISVEIPDPVQDPKLYAVVTGQLMHGPCGIINPVILYIKKDKTGRLVYSKGYLKQFRDET